MQKVIEKHTFANQPEFIVSGHGSSMQNKAQKPVRNFR